MKLVRPQQKHRLRDLFRAAQRGVDHMPDRQQTYDAEQKQHAVDNCFGQTIAVPSGPQRLFFVVCGFDMRAHRSALPECRLIGASENVVGQHYHDRCDHGAEQAHRRRQAETAVHQPDSIDIGIQNVTNRKDGRVVHHKDLLKTGFQKCCPY